ncbi:MAG TPA: LCP family protein [Acidimicrobiales bacterium]|nr:LCP family protein [Acidimicrobiales bacterium]
MARSQGGAQVGDGTVKTRNWPRRLLIGLNLFLALCILASASAFAYVRWRYGQLDKIDLADVLGLGGEEPPGDPMNVLLVGSDTRSNLSRDEQARFGTSSEVGGSRSDTMMILHVDPEKEKAGILSIPRDLWVQIPGFKNKQRINIAFDGKQGPHRLITTIRQNLGIDIDHFVQVDFDGFRGIVQALGGVKVFFPAPARDHLSELAVPEAGCIKLTPEQALAYVRARHFQTYESGRWRTDPTSDFGRIARQQDFMRRVMTAAVKAGIRDPIKGNKIVGRIVDDITIDRALGTGDMLKLAQRFRNISPESVDMVTLPTVPTMVGEADVLMLKEPEAQQVIDRFNGVDPEGAPSLPDVLPQEVSVRVLNGSGIGGQAGKVASDLQAAGFRLATPPTGDADSFRYEKPVVRYHPSRRDDAELLAAYLQSGATLQEDRSLVTADIVLVTGTGYEGVRIPGGAATTTTSAPVTEAEPEGAPRQPQC